MVDKKPNQVEKFIQAARELGYDEDEAAFDVKLKRMTSRRDRGAEDAAKDVPEEPNR